MKKSLGIYIHIPFCISKCLYCDFCSFPRAGRELMENYSAELIRRIRASADMLGSRIIDTVYFGGGTPTLLPTEQIGNILSAIRESGQVADGCEITVECNPATADLSYLSHLRALGVNRLSIGLQSIHEVELRALGRAHTLSDFEQVFSDARRAGFDNISADLMYGIPCQTLESFEKSVEYLARLSPEHISAYGLKIEAGTPFYLKRESLVLPEEDEEYAEYSALSRILSNYGYEKYEISNFSKPDRYSRHNLRYWKGSEYLGFGVAAHSYFDGERFGASRDIDAFLSGKDITEGREIITEEEKFREYIMLSLRLTSGINLAEFKARYGKSFYDFYPKANLLTAQGFFQSDGDRLSFTDKGFFVSNAILSDMLDFN